MKRKKLELFCIGICVCMFILIVFLLTRLAQADRGQTETGAADALQEQTETVSTETSEAVETGTQTSAVIEPEEQGDRETSGAESQALPKYYEKKYMAGAPAQYSEEEIETRLKNLADRYPEFQPIYEHRENYPESLLNNLCCNPNMLDFALGYTENYDHTSGTLETSELEGIPLFIQWDKRWGYAAYGSDVVGLSGCGPTCLSMVVVGLTKNRAATPDALADYATEHGYYAEGAGTSWSFMSEAGEVYGVRGYYISPQKETMQQHLKEGHPLVCAVRSGDFTAQGHFIVITGVDGDSFRVHDPNSIERSSMLWDYDTLQYQISAIWAFEKE